LIVHVHPVHNTLSNVEYLVACPESGETLAIDPWDGQDLASLAEDKGLKISQILNTHAHHDHIRGNEDLQRLTGARVLCHKGALGQIPGAQEGLVHGDFVEVGSVRLRVMDTPGHTMSHICLLREEGPPALFSGDTLFNAGAGNCRHGGHPEALFRTFHDLLNPLADDTRLYPGHDYLRNNLGFTLSREPENQWAKAWLAQPEGAPNLRITTLGEEREINTFFRLDQPEVIAGLQRDVPERELDTPKARFLALRALRNHW
jgi:hydroxyacylglutathione hydrolase